jgi:hypothetical protein
MGTDQVHFAPQSGQEKGERFITREQIKKISTNLSLIIAAAIGVIEI